MQRVTLRICLLQLRAAESDTGRVSAYVSSKILKHGDLQLFDSKVGKVGKYVPLCSCGGAFWFLFNESIAPNCDHAMEACRRQDPSYRGLSIRRTCFTSGHIGHHGYRDRSPHDWFARRLRGAQSLSKALQGLAGPCTVLAPARS